MNLFIYFIIGYLLLLLIWGAICLLSYAVSVFFKKPIIIQSVASLGQTVAYIFYFLFSIYIFYVGIMLFLSHSFIYLVIYILIGATLLKSLVILLSAPFLLISAYFAEINNKIIEGEDGLAIEELNKKLAGFFLADYLVNLVYVVTHPIQYHMAGWWDYLITPLFFMAQNFILFGIIIVIYNKIKHHKFIFRNKKYLCIQVFKTDLTVLIGIQVLAAVLYFVLPL